MLQALAFTGFFLNLFNLLPVVPLDGGRAMAAMAPWMWFVGLGAVITLVFLRPNPILILIAIFGVARGLPALEAPQEGARRQPGVLRRADEVPLARGRRSTSG